MTDADDVKVNQRNNEQGPVRSLGVFRMQNVDAFEQGSCPFVSAETDLVLLVTFLLPIASSTSMSHSSSCSVCCIVQSPAQVLYKPLVQQLMRSFTKPLLAKARGILGEPKQAGWVSSEGELYPVSPESLQRLQVANFLFLAEGDGCVVFLPGGQASVGERREVQIGLVEVDAGGKHAYRDLLLELAKLGVVHKSTWKNGNPFLEHAEREHDVALGKLYDEAAVTAAAIAPPIAPSGPSSLLLTYPTAHHLLSEDRRVVHPKQAKRLWFRMRDHRTQMHRDLFQCVCGGAKFGRGAASTGGGAAVWQAHWLDHWKTCKRNPERRMDDDGADSNDDD